MKKLIFLIILLVTGICSADTLPATNIIANWKASEGITITGSGVSEWQDQSGNGYHLTQSADSGRPVVQIVDSISSLYFDFKYMRMPDALVVDKQACSIFVCYKSDDDLGTVTFVHMDKTNPELTLETTATRWNVDATGVKESSIYKGSSIESVGLVCSPTAATVYLGQESSILAANGAGDTTAGGLIGANAAIGDVLAKTNIYEIAIYSASVDQTTRESVFDYFENTYGALSKDEPTVIIYEGDSLTAGSTLDDPFIDRYPEVSARKSYSQPKSVNLAESGDTLVSQILPEIATVTTALSNNSDYTNRIVVLWAGTNDLPTRTSEQIISDLDDCITAIRAGDAGAIIVVNTLTSGDNAKRATVNAYIMGAVIDTDISVDLANTPGLDDPSDTAYYNVDGVHQNTAGTEIVAQTIFNALESAGYLTAWPPRTSIFGPKKSILGPVKSIYGTKKSILGPVKSILGGN